MSLGFKLYIYWKLLNHRLIHPTVHSASPLGCRIVIWSLTCPRWICDLPSTALLHMYSFPSQLMTIPPFNHYYDDYIYYQFISQSCMSTGFAIPWICQQAPTLPRDVALAALCLQTALRHQMANPLVPSSLCSNITHSNEASHDHPICNWNSQNNQPSYLALIFHYYLPCSNILYSSLYYYNNFLSSIFQRQWKWKGKHHKAKIEFVSLTEISQACQNTFWHAVYIRLYLLNQ